ncbi:TnsA-like heteromeric transposase endonuclease subunit [Streptomyces cyaneofuscatus]|uniref:TnsA-like heteromeric transposase endonuclease subunit n=1 Tax=Streptomyces cyaneofuscatus TaxID=66883 RepID=UPI003F4E767E
MGFVITDSSQDGLPAIVGSACRVPEPGAVEAEFAGADGTLVQRRWVEAAVAVRSGQLAPVAAFPVVPGRRWGPGWWWPATTGRHVMHGPQARCMQLMILDRDPHVVSLPVRPVRLIWRDPDSRRALTWVPQLFTRYADGRALLADCPATTAPAAHGLLQKRLHTCRTDPHALAAPTSADRPTTPVPVGAPTTLRKSRHHAQLTAQP